MIFSHSLTLIKRLFLLLILYSLARGIFLLLNFNAFENISASELLKIFFFGLRFDISTIVWTNILIIFLHLIPFSFRNVKIYQKILKFLFVFINSLFLFSNIADAEYFKFIGKRSTAYTLKLFGGNDKVQADAVRLLPEFLKDFWFVLVISLVLGFLLYYFYPNFSKEKLKNTKKTFIFESLIFILGCFLWLVAARGGLQMKPISIITAAKYTSPQNIPLILNTPFSIMKTLDKEPLETRQYFAKNILDTIFSPEIEFTFSENIRKTNVVVIILESFSREYIGCCGARESFTPFFDSLAAQGLLFTEGFSNGTQSIEAIPSVCASIPALMDEPFITSYYIDNSINSLPSILKQFGYSSAFFHGATNGSLGFDNFSKVASFDNYFGRTEYKNDKDFDGSWGIFDDLFFSFAVEKMKLMKKPFFSCIMTLSSHHPYKIPQKYQHFFAEGSLEIHKSIRYADFSLRKFFQEAKKTDWFSNTLFILTADHPGPAFSKDFKNRIGKYSVPILFFHPQDSTLKGKNDSLLVQQIDIFPSVVDYLHCSTKIVSFGNSIFRDSLQRFAVMFQNGLYQIVEKPNILLFDGEKSVGFFNYKRDKWLQNNLVDSNLMISAKMESKLKAIIQQFYEKMEKNDLKVK